MKIFLALSLFCLIFISCSKTEIVTKPDTPPILEISQNAQGVWNVTGRTLFFRLYDNGTVEFEYPDNKKKVAGKTVSKAEEINTLKQTNISKEEIRKFIELLNSDNFQRVKDAYTRKCCCTDASVNYEINVQTTNSRKSVELFGYCDLGELINPKERDSPLLPHIISDLMSMTYDSRVKLNSSNQIQ